MTIQNIGALFVVLVIILAVNPRIINDIYSSLLGRLLLVCLVIFFAIHNTTLGLLVALAIIVSLNQFGSFVENMENITPPTTIGEDNITNNTGQTILTKSATEDAKKNMNNIKKTIPDQNDTLGVDKEDIKTAIMSKDSKQIPVDPNMNSSSEVNASSSGMLKPSSASFEGFSTFASANY